MACYWPIPALQYGSEPPRLWPPKGAANLALPCGKCIGCRQARATQWAVRCKHEAAQWRHNTFITLTYDDDNAPKEGHLEPEELQRFFKRLRKHAYSTGSSIDSDRSGNIRYFACGEYGDKTDRPHYHALLFNAGFIDARKVGKDLWESDALKELWPYGANRLGEATPAAAGYIAKYGLKKQGAGDHDKDGVWRPAPFLRMSLKPAIGSKWLEKYGTDLQHGYLEDNGFKHGVPRSYQAKLAPMALEQLKQNAAKHRFGRKSDHNHPDRLRAAEVIHERRKQLTENRTI